MSAYTAKKKREWLERQRLREEMAKADPEPVEEQGEKDAPHGQLQRLVVTFGAEDFQLRLAKIMLEVAGATGTLEVNSLADSELRLMIECVSDLLCTTRTD